MRFRLFLWNDLFPNSIINSRYETFIIPSTTLFLTYRWRRSASSILGIEFQFLTYIRKSYLVISSLFVYKKFKRRTGKCVCFNWSEKHLLENIHVYVVVCCGDSSVELLKLKRYIFHVCYTPFFSFFIGIIFSFTLMNLKIFPFKYKIFNFCTWW